MTNEMIIYNAKCSLFDAGLLSGTGRFFDGIDGEGNPVKIPEIEEIHTFQRWKDLGFVVRKGEKAIAKITIWKASAKKTKNAETGEVEEVTDADPALFMKTSAFFAAHQVEPLKA